MAEKNKSKLIPEKEMSQIYDALREIDKKEVDDAIRHKNTLRKDHVFDVLSEKGKITYSDIHTKLKELCSYEIETGSVIFSNSAGQVIFEEGKIYFTNRNEDGIIKKTEVRLAFIPLSKEIKDSKIPTLILPRNEFNIAISRQARAVSFTSISGENFKFSDIVKEGIEKEVSDIHLTYSEKYYYISYRINGDLIYQPKYLLNREAGITFFKKIKQEAAAFSKGAFHSDEHDLPMGARLEYPSFGVDVRLQFTPKGTLTGDNSMTARILTKQTISGESFSFKDKGYDDDMVDLLKVAARLSSGLILVAGITGSGKSTLLSYFTVTLPKNKRIMSFEDPIEYSMEGSHITQHQEYRPDDERIAFTFADGIKSSKRSDPDVIYIGEIRKDTKGSGENGLLASVLESSKAGQLVLSTVHINSAFDIYNGMEAAFGVSSKILSDTLLLTINQVLVKKLCPYCKIEDTEDINKKNLKAANDMGMIRYAYKKKMDQFLEDNHAVTYLRNQKGCEKCQNGILGRKPIYEYLKPSVEMIKWFSEDKSHFDRFSVEEYACSQENKYLAKNKLTTYIEALIAGEVDTHEDVLDKLVS